MKNDEEQIRELVSTWMKATKEGDSQTVLSLMTDDVQFLVAGQPPFGKAAFEQAAKAQSNSAMEIDGEHEIQEINIVGDWAFMVAKLKVTVSQPGQKKLVREGNTLTIFAKQQGRWLLYRDANLLVPVTDIAN